jgi:hypothetical protein
MKRYNQENDKMVEHQDGVWISSEDHDQDYIRRWTALNKEYELVYKKFYSDSVLIYKYKLITFTLSVLLLISMVF